MRKRRRLADKLTIMVCAVLVAVSAFFYVPMDVSAEEIVTLPDDVLTGSYDVTIDASIYPVSKFIRPNFDIGFFDFSSYLEDDVVYCVDLTTDVVFNTSVFGQFGVSTMHLGGAYGDVFRSFNANGNGNPYLLSPVGNSIFYAKGSDLKKVITFRSVFFTTTSSENCTFDFSYNYVLNSISALTGAESASYLQGYNAGYSAGEQVGESNGYSNGYSDGYEAGEQSGYDSGFESGEQSGFDSGFQAGQDSVDTESYYDAGYSAGYDTGYLEGYEEGYNLGYDEGFSAGEAVGYEKGYESGWQAFKDKISGWGADTSDYPVLVFEKQLTNVRFPMEIVTNLPSVGYGQSTICNLDVDINPFHTYKVVFESGLQSTSVNDFSGSQNEQFNYNIGSLSIPLAFGESFAFVQGSNLASVFRLEVYDYSSHFYDIDGVFDNTVFQPWSASRTYTFHSIGVYVYDMGPSGDTQNHIANQTDQLTGGYNDSHGNSVNNEFSSGLNEFETAEDSLFVTATTGMKDFTFFDLSSVPAMLTGMSFVGSVMTGWFNQAGGASGVGIVLSILFSIMLVAMVLGLYRWYQSKGGKD